MINSNEPGLYIDQGNGVVRIDKLLGIIFHLKKGNFLELKFVNTHTLPNRGGGGGGGKTFFFAIFALSRVVFGLMAAGLVWLHEYHKELLQTFI